ncbi:hypothetical protein FBU30_005102, partial [Linnemannia zychae]
TRLLPVRDGNNISAFPVTQTEKGQPKIASSPRINTSSSSRKDSSKLSSSITRQSTLITTKDSIIEPTRFAISSSISHFFPIVATTPLSTATSIDAASNLQAQISSLHINTDKQPEKNTTEMSSLLNRVLDKAAAPNNDNATAPSRSNKRETRSSTKPSKDDSGKESKQSGGNNDEDTHKVDSLVNTTVDNKTSSDHKNPTTATKGTPLSPTSTTAPTGSRSKKNPGSPSTTVTSIAERLPKGSRVKPLPVKSPTPTSVTTPSFPTSVLSDGQQQQQTQAGDKLSQAISLSSSMPSFSSQIEQFSLDEDGDQQMTEDSAFYFTLASEGDGDDRHNSKSRELAAKHTRCDHDSQQEQSMSKKETSGKARHDSPAHQLTTSVDATHGTDISKKQPSIISIANSKDEYASAIPSAQVERITNWMGGIRDAMENDDASQPNITTESGHQQHYISASSIKHDNDTKPATLNKTIKKIESVEESPAAVGSRKPALRRLPPAPSRHMVTLVDASPPLPPEEQAQSIFEIVPSSLLEDEPLERNYRQGQKILEGSKTALQGSKSKGKRIFVEDSLASLPPVSLFHENSDIGDGDTADHHSKSEGKPSITPSKTDFTRPVSSRENHSLAQDDPSAIDGRHRSLRNSQIGTMQSLPLSSYAEEAQGAISARSEGANNDNNTDNAETEMEHILNNPSLPSELTASCLQELGLKRKNVQERGYGPGKRRTKKRVGYGIRGDDFNGILEENMEEDEESKGEEDGNNGVPLAQRAAFPSSFDLAPISTLSSSVTPPLSLEVIEGPLATYTPAGRTSNRENKENEKHSLSENVRRQQADSSSNNNINNSNNNNSNSNNNFVSPPPPPASLVFSTLPSMPTFPTFPTFPSLHQEPSLIILDSQSQQTQTQQMHQTENEDMDHED